MKSFAAIEVIGYLLKVIKSGVPISYYQNDAFNALKHGNYYDFINMIQEEEIPEIYSFDLNWGREDRR